MLERRSALRRAENEDGIRRTGRMQGARGRLLQFASASGGRKAQAAHNSHEIQRREANLAHGIVKADNKSEDGFFGSKSWMK